MTTAEEMRRISEFFGSGARTYGDSGDDSVTPDMYDVIDPATIGDYDEYGEKTNPTGRSIDRALRRFFGIDNFAPSPAANMVSLDSELNDEDDNVADNLRTTYDEGNPPTLQKVTTETLEPISALNKPERLDNTHSYFTELKKPKIPSPYMEIDRTLEIEDLMKKVARMLSGQNQIS
jgi:hypothetical protein